MGHEAWAELAEAIGAVRAELQAAMAAGEGSALQFRTGPGELEFTVDVQKHGEAGTKVLVLPWSAQAKAGAASGRTQRIKLTLQPIDSQGEDARISRSSAERPL
ncbi:trypco2 family protein [Streptomyces monticola]|uniref:Trypco2 family protein n=1 Tax=Streptomyces monticola TaxID=2666263 RepID=A0ABW2JND6_9ACTN